MPRYALAGLLLTLVIVTAAVASYLVPDAPASAVPLRPTAELDESVIVGPPKVKLAVLVVFDQMRGDYIVKWRPHFPPGGFQRLMNDGCWFSECYYPYATTTTGPGHAAIMSGTTQDFTGIINNDWYDRALGQRVYCATTPRHENVNSGTAPGFTRPTKVHSTFKKPEGGGSPDRLIAPSIGDSVKASGRGGKVIGLSIKDRSAIFPSGHYADAAYWGSAEFGSSTYYMDSLPLWVRQFNERKLPHSYYGKTWERFRPDLDYAAIAGSDKSPGEGKRAGLGLTFPHPMTGGETGPKDKFFEALVTSPYGNEVLLEFAKAAIDAEQLGQRDASDLLTISFSSNDLIGHAFGPDSQEVFDITLRSDRTIAELLRVLDEKVGPGNYSLVMTADHGICPLPDVSRARGIDASYVDAGKIGAEANTFLNTKYGKPVGTKPMVREKNDPRGNLDQWIESNQPPWIYINHRQIEARKLNRDAVTEALAAHLRKQPNLYRVYTAKQIETQPANDAIDRLVKASYHPERSGDIFLLPKPYCFFGSDKDGGTTHGSPFEYDRHVPLVVYGPGLPKGQQSEPVAPQHAAVIIADFLGLKPPRDALFALPKSFSR